MAMAFPLRKVKSHKISKFVNDHLHKSRKRRDGSSLVVETGFPTSLVDLFMKNREKLKKPLKNKRNDNHKPSIDIADDPVPCEITPLIRSSVASDDGNEILDVGVANDEIKAVADEHNGDSRSNLMVVFKMFLVVLFVVGTNRLTTGISISAFVLFFLDFFRAKLLFCRLSDNQNIGLDLVQGRDYGLTETEIVETGDTSAVIMEEIQEETEGSTSQEVQKEDLLEQDDPKSKKTSKRAKIKAKLKRFFAKRFKGKKGKTEEVNQTVNEVVPAQIVRGLLSISSSSSREDDIVPAIAPARESIPTGKVDKTRKRTRIQFRAKETRAWRRVFLFCLIILVGLLGSRPFSILLTVFSFFFAKFVESHWA